MCVYIYLSMTGCCKAPVLKYIHVYQNAACSYTSTYIYIDALQVAAECTYTYRYAYIHIDVYRYRLLQSARKIYRLLQSAREMHSRINSQSARQCLCIGCCKGPILYIYIQMYFYIYIYIYIHIYTYIYIGCCKAPVRCKGRVMYNTHICMYTYKFP